jgi:hypothetical protein
MQPSYDVFHPLGAAQMARHVSVASILSERSGWHGATENGP